MSNPSRIVSPTTVVNGTILSASLLQQLIDNSNILFGLTCDRFEDHFLWQQVTAQTATGVCSNTPSYGSPHWQVATISNGQFVSGAAAGTGQVTGYANFRSNGTGTCSVNVTGGPFSLQTTSDYYVYWRAKIITLANLDTLASRGFYVGIGPGVVAGNNSAHWNILKPDTTLVDSGVAITDGTYYTFLMTRLGGTLTFYINGSSVYSQSDSTTPGTNLQMKMVGLSSGGANDYAHVDVIGFLFPHSAVS